MFSLLTSLVSAAPRPPAPIMAIFSFSFGETWRGCDGAAELLAYMYDRSLDLFAPHSPPSVLGLYPSRTSVGWARATLGEAGGQFVSDNDFREIPGWAGFHRARCSLAKAVW